MKGCINCKHRSKEGHERYYKGIGIDVYYPCPILSAKGPSKVSVPLDHKACKNWEEEENDGF